MTKKLRMNEWGPPLYFLKERERFSHDPFKNLLENLTWSEGL